jgi:hypothetical protein
MLVRRPTGLISGGLAAEFSAANELGLGVHNELVAQVLRFGLVGGLLFSAMIIRGIAVRPSSDGWAYSIPVAVMGMILVIEAASGLQLQTAMLLVLAFSACHDAEGAIRPVASHALEDRSGSPSRGGGV